MSPDVQMPPSAEVLETCKRVDHIIEAYLTARRSADLSRRFEAPMEVRSILNMMLRFSESIIALAREDMVLVPAANVVARSLLEAGYKAMWLLQPRDPFEREARWLASLRAGIKHYRGLANSTCLSSRAREAYAAQADQHQKFADDLDRRLEEEGNLVAPLPKFREVAVSTTMPDCYHLFILLSAYTHTNFAALEFYRRNLGTAKSFGEFISASSWVLSLSVAGGVFYLVAQAFLENHDVDVSVLFPETLQVQFHRAIASIR
jgi:hypothetical protein